MANIKSSKKSIRKIAKLTMRNKAEKSRIKTASKKLRALKESGDAEAIKVAAKALMSVADKAGKHGVWHKNKVNRIKSRLTPLMAGAGLEQSPKAAGSIEAAEAVETKDVAKPSTKKTAAKTVASKKATAKKPTAKKASTKKTATAKKSASKKAE